ncbi:hypothetical protein C8Q74DRAFT_1363884 [Fomes fomentarius]|nr:hypothetical protein C8Q74DRAFT_1363884 [Fomes fomentarius]
MYHLYRGYSQPNDSDKAHRLAPNSQYVAEPASYQPDAASASFPPPPYDGTVVIQQPEAWAAGDQASRRPDFVRNVQAHDVQFQPHGGQTYISEQCPLWEGAATQSYAATRNVHASEYLSHSDTFAMSPSSSAAYMQATVPQQYAVSSSTSLSSAPYPSQPMLSRSGYNHIRADQQYVEPHGAQGGFNHVSMPSFNLNGRGIPEAAYHTVPVASAAQVATYTVHSSTASSSRPVVPEAPTPSKPKYQSYRIPLSDDVDPDFVFPINSTRGGIGLQMMRCNFSRDIQKSLPYIVKDVVDADKIRLPVGAWGSVTWDRALFPGERVKREKPPPLVRGEKQRHINMLLGEVLWNIVMKQHKWFLDFRHNRLTVAARSDTNPVWTRWVEWPEEAPMSIVALRRTRPNEHGIVYWVPEIELRYPY